MKKTLLLVMYITLVSFANTFAQNLLSSSTWWDLGQGSVTGFSANGSASENVREISTAPNALISTVLWKAVNDKENNADGGWNSDYVNIDHTKTYRFSVWLKKTNSHNGYSYLGCSSNNHILKLNGEVNNNPYFWYGDLPQLDKWYVVVGYVHGSSYIGTTNFGGIYDGETGEKVKAIQDFKFKAGATSVRHRSYLYYDTNPNDRQYFWEPRIEDNSTAESIQDIIKHNKPLEGNLLDISSWSIGQGSTKGFNINGSIGKNSREWGKNHVGEDVILWKATNDAESHADGGWNSWSHPIDHTRAYRYIIWLKKTNSNDGHSYLGCQSYSDGSNHILNLSGSINPNPYFWVGDLPELNKWYMVVGFVHGSGYTGTGGAGGIYDGETAEKVKTITDFKFKNTAKLAYHRTYLYYDTNTKDRQYFYAPRMEMVTGKEPTIKELFKINNDSKVTFTFDAAGNQTKRFYCKNADCNNFSRSADEEDIPLPPNEDNEKEDTKEDVAIFNSIKLHPNPTSNIIKIELSPELLEHLESAQLYNTNSILVKNLNFNNKEQIKMSLKGLPTGVYFLHMHLKNSQSITKKIIKK